MDPSQLKYIFGGAAALLLGAGLLRRPHRWSLWVSAACAGAAAAAAHHDAFWTMAIAGIGMVWALLTANEYVDFGWRFRVGMTAAVAIGSFLCVWPTLNELSHGKIPCPQYIKERVDFRLVAGLDLRGGLRLVYTVDVEEAIKDKRDKYFDDVRAELATAYGIKPADKAASREDFAKVAEKVEVTKSRSSVAIIALNFKDPADVSKLDDEKFKRFESEMARTRGSSAGEVVYKIRAAVETNIRETAVNQAKDTIGRRVDELGLREAAVSVRDEDIIVEVPGEDQRAFNEIREIIGKTARLEFKMVDDGVNFFETIRQKQDKAPPGVSYQGEQAPFGPGKTTMVTYARMMKNKDETLKQTRDRFRAWLSTLEIPSDHEVGLEVLREVNEQGVEEEIGWRTMYLFSKAEITGDQIRHAGVQQDTQRTGGGYLVGLQFTESGARHFEEVTGANVQKRFAIILDDAIQSAPRILTKIGGGGCTITMGTSDPDKQLQEAKRLELVLKAGALPAPITPSNEQRIGASLGSDAIKQGIFGAIAGASIVLVFIAVYYSVAGIIADVAVIFNLFLQISLLATFGAAMTLPGIAGLALTVGMAIDANVLINERIREELRQGKSARTAIELGYDKALSAIIDGHMTTFISGLILAQYGTGPIKGFAVTLLVGMVVSLYTSVICTRLGFDFYVRGLRKKTIPVG